ncbi:MAG: IS110 family transposase [Actinobacteria bacterium]|nr:IS110 family transposase [Actinomycetota bacterium]
MKPTYSYLKEKNISCLLLNPYQVKKYRQALGIKIKTDSIDLRICCTTYKG